MRKELKARGEIIEAYAEAFRSDESMKRAAELLKELVDTLNSFKSLSERQMVLCLAQEIDSILCGYSNSRKLVAYDGKVHRNPSGKLA